MDIIKGNSCNNNNNTKADELNHYFIELPQVNKNKFPQLGDSTYQIRNNQSEGKFTLQQVTEECVLKVVRNMKGKNSKDYYGFSNNFIKKTIFSYIKPLTKLINSCFQEGIFPEELKVVKVVPVFKKGDMNDAANYRPIAIVPVISKIMESIIAHQLSDYFEQQCYFMDNQYGYRKNRTTVNAICALVEQIIEAYENKEVCVVTFCDLSKAFDMVSHKLLLKKLQCYGITDKEGTLFKQYLTGRLQYVSLKEESSALKTVEYGVPQGSVLGPLLFLIYYNDVGDDYILFADDTTYIRRGKIREEVMASCSDKQFHLETWLKNNQLHLNKEKTVEKEFRITNKENDSPVSFLGIILDSGLTWKDHIQNLASELSRIVYMLRKLREEVSIEVLRIAYFGLFQSKLSYGILLWGAAPYTASLFKIQKRALRVIYKKDKRHSCKSLFIENNILTLPSLFIKVNILSIKENENTESRSERHHYDVRNKLDLHLPKSRLVKSEKTPSIMAPKLFNKIPQVVREMNIKQFKKILHTFLVKNCFYNLSEFLSAKRSATNFVVD